MTTIRFIGAFLLALIILPFLGLFELICLAYAGLGRFLRFFKDLWFSLADPAYIPNIGIGGMRKREHECIYAARAAAAGDWAAAVAHWKAAGRLYDAPSMLRLGECYEAGKGVTASKGAAYEYYALAAQYGMKEGNASCQRLQESRFTKKERKEFAKTMWA